MAPNVTVGHIRELLADPPPCKDPVLFVNTGGELEIGPRAYTTHHAVVIDREAANDYINVPHAEPATDDDIAFLLTDIQTTVDHVVTRLAE